MSMGTLNEEQSKAAVVLWSDDTPPEKPAGNPIIARFAIRLNELEKIIEWESGHDCPQTEVGAAGGKTTYSFTDTNMGQVTVASCACGSTINVTDYHDW